MAAPPPRDPSRTESKEQQEVISKQAGKKIKSASDSGVALGKRKSLDLEIGLILMAPRQQRHFQP